MTILQKQNTSHISHTYTHRYTPTNMHAPCSGNKCTHTIQNLTHERKALFIGTAKRHNRQRTVHLEEYTPSVHISAATRSMGWARFTRTQSTTESRATCKVLASHQRAQTGMQLHLHIRAPTPGNDSSRSLRRSCLCMFTHLCYFHRKYIHG